MRISSVGVPIPPCWKVAHPAGVVLCNVSGSVLVLAQCSLLPSVLGRVSVMTQGIWNGFGYDVRY